MFRVTKNDNSSNYIVLQGAINDDSNIDISQLVFQNYDADTSNRYDVASIGIRDHQAIDGIGDLLFKTRDVDGLKERMRILFDGNVGLGTDSPSARFDVSGSVFASSNLEASSVLLASNNFIAGAHGFSGSNSSIRSKNNALELLVNGLNVALISSTGVGVGVSNTDSMLELSGNLRFDGTIYKGEQEWTLDQSAISFASNAIAWTSNKIAYDSNTIESILSASSWTSNSLMQASNEASWALTTIESASNLSLWNVSKANSSSNLIYDALEKSTWTSNVLYSNASYSNAILSKISPASNEARANSNESATLLDAAYWSSNTGAWASNAIATPTAIVNDAISRYYAIPGFDVERADALLIPNLSNVSILSNLRPSSNMMSVDWYASIDWTGSQTATAIAADVAGNSYLSGVLSSPSVIINANNVMSGQVVTTFSGGTSACVVKFNGEGKAVWVASVEGPGTDRANGIALDSNMNVYFAGFYGIGGATIYNSNNLNSGLFLRNITAGTACFLVKYDSNGFAQWFTSLDVNTTNDQALGVAVDKEANAYMCGFYNGIGVVYNHSNTNSGFSLRNSSNVTGTVSDAAFATKYNSNGEHLWSVSMDAMGSDRAMAICVDSKMNLYLGGYYTSSNCFIYNSNNIRSPVTLPSTNLANNAAFLISFDSNGQSSWAASVDGGSVDQAVGVKADSTGNVYITGYYTSNAVVYNASNVLSSNILVRTSNNSIGAFLVKYNSNGVSEWTMSLDGSSADYGVGVDVDSEDSVYMTGYYSNVLVVYDKNGSNTNMSLNTNTNSGAFFLKVNSNGIPLCAGVMDSVGTDTSVGIALDGRNNVFVGGTYGNNVLTLYDAKTTSNVVSSLTTMRETLGNAGTACFIAKYSPDPHPYRIASSLGIQDTGQYKILLNGSSNKPAILQMRNSNDTTTYQTITISPYSAKTLFWNGTDWSSDLF